MEQKYARPPIIFYSNILPPHPPIQQHQPKTEKRDNRIRQEKENKPICECGNVR